MPTFRQDNKLGDSVPLIKTPDIGDKQVTERKLADGSVTSSKLSTEIANMLSLLTTRISAFKVADNLSSLPTEENTIGWLVDNHLYVYVGNGSTPEAGMYQDCGELRGPQGIQGEQGLSGLNGKSAYDIWTEQPGNEDKSEIDFLEFTRGSKGDKGDQGERGYDISNIEQIVKSTEDGGKNVIRVTRSDGWSKVFEILNGSKGSKGDKGTSIVKLEQTRKTTESSGLNTIEATLGDGTKESFEIYNGAKGEQGDKGEKGDKGDQGEIGPQGNSGIADASNKTLVNDAITGGETDFLSAEVGKLGILTYDCSKGGTITHATLQDAINSVPTTFQKVGLNITYKSGNTIYRYTLKANAWSADPANWFSVEDKLSDLSNVYDCSLGGTLKFTTLFDAINSVPIQYKKGGLHISYLDDNGNRLFYTLNSSLWSEDVSKWVLGNYNFYIEPSGTGVQDTISVNLKDNSISINKLGFSLFCGIRSYVNFTDDITFTAKENVTRTSIYLSESILCGDISKATKESFFIVKEDVNYNGILFAEWYHGVLQPTGLVASLVVKENSRIEHLKDILEIYPSDNSNVYIENDIANKKVFLNIPKALRIRVAITKDYVSIDDIANELETEIVTSTKGIKKCIAINDGFCLVCDLYDRKLCLINRFYVKNYHAIIAISVGGILVFKSDKYLFCNTNVNAIESIENSLKDVKNEVKDRDNIRYISSYSFSDNSSGHSFVLDVDIRKGTRFFATYSVTNNISAKAIDLYAYYADGTNYKLTQEVLVDKKYSFVADKDIVNITAYQQASALSGNAGNATLCVETKSIRGAINDIEKIISEDTILGTASHTFTGSETSGVMLQIIKDIPKGTRVFFKVTDENSVSKNMIDVLFYSGETSNKVLQYIYSNTVYSVIAQEDIQKITILQQAEKLTGRSGEVTFEVFTRRLDSVVEDITAKEYSLTPEWKEYADEIQGVRNGNFLMCIQTDTHLSLVNSSSPKFSGIDPCNNLRLLAAYCGADGIANIGDLIRGYEDDTPPDMRRTMSEAAMRYCYPKACPTFLVVGNHDDNFIYYDHHKNEVGSSVFPKNEVFDRMIKPSLNTFINVTHQETNMYYYVDYTDIRVIVLNSQDGGTSLWNFGFSDAQVDWFKTKALNTDKQVLVMCHCPLLSSLTSDCPDSASKIINALKEFKTGGGVVIGCLAGHTHRQQLETDSNGITHIVFKNSRVIAESIIVDVQAKKVKTVVLSNPSLSMNLTSREWGY